MDRHSIEANYQIVGKNGKPVSTFETFTEAQANVIMLLSRNREERYQIIELATGEVKAEIGDTWTSNT